MHALGADDKHDFTVIQPSSSTASNGLAVIKNGSGQDVSAAQVLGTTFFSCRPALPPPLPLPPSQPALDAAGLVSQLCTQGKNRGPSTQILSSPSSSPGNTATSASLPATLSKVQVPAPDLPSIASSLHPLSSVFPDLNKKQIQGIVEEGKLVSSSTLASSTSSPRPVNKSQPDSSSTVEDLDDIADGAAEAYLLLSVLICNSPLIEELQEMINTALDTAQSMPGVTYPVADWLLLLTAHDQALEVLTSPTNLSMMDVTIQSLMKTLTTATPITPKDVLANKTTAGRQSDSSPPSPTNLSAIPVSDNLGSISAPSLPPSVSRYISFRLAINAALSEAAEYSQLDATKEADDILFTRHGMDSLVHLGASSGGASSGSADKNRGGKKSLVPP